MTRPPSIVLFERLYLGSLAIYLINAAMFWTQSRDTVAAMPQIQANPAIAALVPPIMLGSLAVTVLFAILFWWLVARQRSEVGKWLVVVTEAIGGLFGLFALLQLVWGTAVNPTAAAIGLLATALAVAAAVVLFRPDARAWFGEEPGVTLP